MVLQARGPPTFPAHSCLQRCPIGYHPEGGGPDSLLRCFILKYLSVLPAVAVLACLPYNLRECCSIDLFPMCVSLYIYSVGADISPNSIFKGGGMREAHKIIKARHGFGFERQRHWH